MKKIAILIITILTLSSCSVKYEYVDENYEAPKTAEAKEEVKEEIISEEISLKLSTIQNLKVRAYPSTEDTSKQVGKIAKGSEIIAYEAYKDDEYTWYRIGTNQWVADDGTWTKRSNITIKYRNANDTDFNGTLIRVNNEADIYDDKRKSSDKVGLIGYSSVVTYFEKSKVDGEEWYRIGTSQWICNDAEDKITPYEGNIGK